MTGREDLARSGFKEALRDAKALAYDIQTGWPEMERRLPREAIDGALSGLDQGASALAAETRKRGLEEVYDGFLEVMSGAFAVGYRANQAASGVLEPEVDLTDAQRSAAIRRVVEQEFKPTVSREIEGFLVVAAVMLKEGDDMQGRQQVIDIFKAGFYLGWRAYENRRDD